MHATTASPLRRATIVLRAIALVPLTAGVAAAQSSPAVTARLSGTATFRQHGDTVWFTTTAHAAAGAQYVFLLRGDTAVLLAPKVPQPVMPRFGRTLRDMVREAQEGEALRRRLDALGVPRRPRSP